MQKVFLALYRPFLAALFASALAILGWAAQRTVNTFDKMESVHGEILSGVQNLNLKFATEMRDLKSSLHAHEQTDVLTFRPLITQLNDHENRLRAVEGKPLVPFRYGP